MKDFAGAFYRSLLIVAAMVLTCALPSSRMFAQDVFRSDDDPNVTFEEPSDAQDQNTGPIRLARFAYIGGNVTWRSDGSSEWTHATVNMPIREGAEIWVTDGGHADVQFDDGSSLRLGSGALATLKSLYSDKEGEFTQISLNDGLATIFTRHDNSIFQIDTPAASIKTRGAAQIRFGIDNGSEISVQRGEAVVESAEGSKNLNRGDYLYLADTNSPFDVRPAPAGDSWDRWNDERNRLLEGGRENHVPSNIGLVSGELNDYGDWRSDSSYGWVWCPRGVANTWRPYYHGSWTYCDPFGWTWVSSEPWGWAPYHYGTWVHLSYGWGWCPGPVHQYWSPAVVHFSTCDGNVAWAPLCPWEVHYPAALSFGYWGRNWAFSFSIGGAGVYYPRGGYCVARAWSNHFINRWDRSRGSSPSFERFARSNEFAAANNRFIPYNASHFAGASYANAGAFGGHGRYETLASGQTGYFTRGRYSAPTNGRTPYAGPISIAPTAASRTPTRTFVTDSRPSQAVERRPLYHAPTPTTGRNRPSDPTFGGGGRTPSDPGTGRNRPSDPTFGGGGRTPSDPGTGRNRPSDPTFGGGGRTPSDPGTGRNRPSDPTFGGGGRTPSDPGTGRNRPSDPTFGGGGRTPSDPGTGRNRPSDPTFGGGGRTPSDPGTGRNRPSDPTFGGGGRTPSDPGTGRNRPSDPTFGGGGRTPGNSSSSGGSADAARRARQALGYGSGGSSGGSSSGRPGSTGGDSTSRPRTYGGDNSGGTPYGGGSRSGSPRTYGGGDTSGGSSSGRTGGDSTSRPRTYGGDNSGGTPYGGGSRSGSPRTYGGGDTSGGSSSGRTGGNSTSRPRSSGSGDSSGSSSGGSRSGAPRSSGGGDSSGSSSGGSRSGAPRSSGGDSGSRGSDRSGDSRGSDRGGDSRGSDRGESRGSDRSGGRSGGGRGR